MSENITLTNLVDALSQANQLYDIEREPDSITTIWDHLILYWDEPNFSYKIDLWPTCMIFEGIFSTDGSKFEKIELDRETYQPLITKLIEEAKLKSKSAPKSKPQKAAESVPTEHQTAIG